MEQLSLSETKEVAFQILCEIDAIFKKNRIEYCLAYGTLIGAIRHGGFIPWDDDIDIWVPAGEYQRALEVLDKQSKYELINNLQNSDWPRIFSKLSDRRTVVVDERKNALHLKRGVAVDIFPLARFNDYSATSQAINKFQKILLLLYKDRNRKCVAKSAKQIAAFAICKMNLYQHKDEAYWQKRALECEMEQSEGTYCAFLGSVYGAKDVHPNQNFGEYIAHTFEGKSFPVPLHYDAVLKQIYGNYMELPPEEKRVSRHDVKVYWKE